MAFTAADSVWFNATSTGLGDFVVASALAGYRTPATASIANGSTIHYSARTATEFENGEGVYTSGTVTLSRVTIFASSNSNAKVNFAAIPTVAITPLAEDVIFPPASSTDSAIALWDGTGGDAVKNSSLTVSGTVINGASSVSLATAGTVRLGIDTSGGGSIGTDQNAESRFTIENTNTGASASASLDVLSGDGTAAEFVFSSVHSGGYSQLKAFAGALTFQCDQAVDIQFKTNATTAMRVDGSQRLLVQGPGLGYGNAGGGTGGAVTQLTSRTTTVTLNNACGAITLFAAAPVVGTWVSFTVNDSTVAATDVVNVSVKSGTNTYVALVSLTAAGSFRISFMSIAGTASDSPVLNFAVIKAVAN